MLSRFQLACSSGAMAVQVALCSPAFAQNSSTDSPAESATDKSAEAGMFLPHTMAPRTDSQTAFATALGGYDSAHEGGLLEGTADATLVGPVAVRLGVVYAGNPETLRPTIGARVQALSQENHGIDMTIGGFYRPEGFTEAEGELEAVLAFGRRFGRLGTFANLVYGQDPEGAERDGEIRLAALYAVSELFQAGLDSRLRFDLGSEAGKRRVEGEAEYDLLAGPTASYSLGAVAIVAEAGVSAVGRKDASRVGAIALAGLAGSF